MIPVCGEQQSVDEVYTLLLKAASGKQPVVAVYDDLPRLLCPHVLDRNRQGQLRALCTSLEAGAGVDSIRNRMA